MRRGSAAFTLLEVMAAVAVVAIVFTTLARVSSEGLRSEGISKRRFEASLIADYYIARFEFENAFGGIAAEDGLLLATKDVFWTKSSVTSFDIASAIPESGFGDIDPTTEATLAGVLGDEVSPVLAIEVTVTWYEGVTKYRVIRNSFGIDRAVLEGLANAGSQSLTPPGNAPSP